MASTATNTSPSSDVSVTDYLVITLGAAAAIPAIELSQQGADDLERTNYGYIPGDDQATIWRNNRAYWDLNQRRLTGISHVLFACEGNIVGAAYLFGSSTSRAGCQVGKTVLHGSPAPSHELIGTVAPARTKGQKNPVSFRQWSEDLKAWV